MTNSNPPKSPDTPDQVDALDEILIDLHDKNDCKDCDVVIAEAKAKLSALLLDARIDELTSVHSNEHEYGEAESRKMMYDRIKDLEKQREATG